MIFPLTLCVCRTLDWFPFLFLALCLPAGRTPPWSCPSTAGTAPETLWDYSSPHNVPYFGEPAITLIRKLIKSNGKKRTASSCICLLNSEHLTTRLFDYATAYKNINIVTSPYMRLAATVRFKSKTCCMFFRQLDTYTGCSCGNVNYIIQVCFWMQVLPTIQNVFPCSQMVKRSYFIKWVISLPHTKNMCLTNCGHKDLDSNRATCFNISSLK